MNKKTKIAIAPSGADLGKPAEYSRTPSDLVKGMLGALIELVQERKPSRIQIGERCATGADTRQAVDMCGVAEAAERTGVELRRFEHAPFDINKIDRPVSFNEFRAAAGAQSRRRQRNGRREKGVAKCL